MNLRFRIVNEFILIILISVLVNNGLLAATSINEDSTDKLSIGFYKNGLIEPHFTNMVYDELYSLSASTGESLTNIRPFMFDSHIITLDAQQAVSKLLELCKIIKKNPKVEFCDPGGNITDIDPINNSNTNILNQNLNNEPSFLQSPLPPFNSLITVNTPVDGAYKLQWGHFKSTTTQVGLNVTNAWSLATGKGVVVAVLDSGLIPHGDIEPARIKPGYDFISDDVSAGDVKKGAAFKQSDVGRDDDPTDEGNYRSYKECGTSIDLIKSRSRSTWHGLKVASIIAATAHNNNPTPNLTKTTQLWIAGVAPKSSILPVRVSGKCGADPFDVAEALGWIGGLTPLGVSKNQTKNVKVVNLSLGRASTKSACPAVFQKAINLLDALGITVVVAAGNDNQNSANYYPSNCKKIISVASISKNGRKYSSSNFGTAITISAPGDMVPALNNVGTKTANPNKIADEFTRMYGTSAAAPYISGMVALLYEKHPNIKPNQVKQLLQKTAQPFTSKQPMCLTKVCGAGIPDAVALLSAPLSGGSTSVFDPAILDVVKNPQLAIAIGLF